MSLFMISADYCVALINTDAYPSFVDPNWTLPQLIEHFVTQMNQGTMLAWGTGAPGNWRISVATRSEAVQGYQEFTGRIKATSTKLHLVSYDDLSMAAQFEDVQLPRQETEGGFFSIKPGEYDCRIVQMYDPAETESEEVFNQVTPHFLLVISEAKGKATEFEQVPWFVAR